MTGSHQDEESLVGELLVLGDGGEHRQHQAAEHQQKTETHNHTKVSRSVNAIQNTYQESEQE